MPSILVTGADGFVGRAIVADLARRGHRVIANDLALDTLERTDGAVIRCAMPVDDLDAHLGPEPLDLMIHAAAITASPESLGLSAAEHIAANLRMTLAMLKMSSRRAVPRFIAISSAGVFSHDHAGPINEAACPDATSAYAAAKRAGEIAVAAAASPALATVSIRFSNLYGPGERPRHTRPRVSLLQAMIDAVDGDARITVSSPDALRDWTFVPDAAARIGELADRSDWPAALLHICAPAAITDRDLAETICAVGQRGRVVVDDGSSTTIRPPCTSLYQSWWRQQTWTPLAEGLRQTTD